VDARPLEDQTDEAAGAGMSSRPVAPPQTARLVIAPNWIGDAVMSLPTLRALRKRFPTDRLAVLARRGPAAIYRAEGSADHVLPRSGFFGDVASVRAGRFDEAWLLPNSLRAALTAFLSGVGRRLGYATDRRGAFLTGALPPPDGTRHQLRDYDALLSHAGVPPDTEPPSLPIPSEAAHRAREALTAAGVPEGGIVLCPGSASDPKKRWPAARFAALADALAGRGVPCALAIGPSERDLGRAVARKASAALPVVGADLDPVELAAVLAAARAVVSNDSGPAHLAAAVGTPVVVFFGPTDPRRTAPVGAPVRVLERMNEVTVEEAARAVVELTVNR
jgi:heptosyltransferase-2